MTKTSLAITAGFIAEIGAKHQQYNDATILIQFKNLVLLAMFDVSTTRPLPKDVVTSAFIHTVDEALNDSHFSASAAALFELLQRFVRSLNHSLKGGSASVAVAWIDAGRVWGYCAGDIRMGVISENMLVWLSPVHTAANINSPFTDELKQHPQRHLLTRSLRPHRPFSPDYFEYILAEGCHFLAASDGFWSDQHWGNLQSLTQRPAQKPDDDCTCIWFSAGGVVSTASSDLRHEQLTLITKYQETVIHLM